ncbi:hypothetical protein F4775DRAFT_598701 [Biscogniauxia sp. FL1348]|nr:hypothetical protein F4775DRAFT_598701 [Biscogniauxia sp. FL1348]
MFGNSRRHRPPNPPLTSATADPNAATAAASAFMSASNQRPDRTLSSAAAAAALRARPHTPTNVAAVQTKRTMRRSASVSSSGSAAAHVGRPTAQLERRPSSGSMTERTFRSPSPHRSTPAQSKQPQPPVPQIPPTHKKSMSLNSAGKMATDHPSWYTQPSGDLSNVRTSDAPMSLGKSPMPRSEPAPSVSQRPESRNSSVNFSYPIGFHAHSPPASPTTASPPQWSSLPPQTPASPPRSSIASISSTGGKSEQPMVYDPNSRRMVPRAQVEAAVDPRGREVAGKQPKRRKRDSGLQRAGSQLAKGTAARVKGTTIDDNKRERVLPKREQPVIEEPPTVEEAAVLEDPAVKTIVTAPQKQPHPEQTKDMQPHTAGKSEVRGSLPASRLIISEQVPPPSSRAMGKRPSTVEEEPEEVYETTSPTTRLQGTPEAMDTIPMGRTKVEQSSSYQSKNQVGREDIGSSSAAGFQPRAQVESPLEGPMQQKTMCIENKPVAELARKDSTIKRSNSNSPARQARFATSPSESLPVRHTPLPRSASPIKSALKRTSPSPRETSPSDNSSDQQELAIPRKKSVRVSFDDRNTMIVGEGAPADKSDDHSPPSPQQAKRPWYSNIGRSKRREFTLDDDEIMKPRPALPSFGSIRDKKARETGERPLVRPLEPAFSPAGPSSPDLRPQSPSTLADSETTEEPYLGQSSDIALGSLLAQDQASRNEANISRFREPLPPVVTSVEGSGYMSDSTRSSDSDDEQPDQAPSTGDSGMVPNIQTTQVLQPEAVNNSQNDSTAFEGNKPSGPQQPPLPINIPPRNLPDISVTQPTPLAFEHDLQLEPSMYQHSTPPGGFPDDDCDGSRVALPSTKSDITGTNFADAIFEPSATVHPAQANMLPQTTLATTAPIGADEDRSTDSSEGSIYSDAQEDLSDVDGDGFMSLDAVVESPVGKNSPTQLHELPGDANGRELQTAHGARAFPRPPSIPQDASEWEKAKSFWRSLTVEKRLQLEREAMEDAGAEGDREEVAQTVRKNINRRKNPEPKQPSADVQHEIPVASTPSQPANQVKVVPAAEPEPKATNEPISSVPKHPRMRTSLREEPTKATKSQPSSGMRKTMRSNGGTGQVDQSSTRRGSAQPEKPEPIPKQNQSRSRGPRPQSIPQEALATSASQGVKPTLQRRGSDASDSSFKRTRATSHEGFGFRRTMRRQSTTPQSTPETVRGSGRFSLRSLSPTGSPFRRSSVQSAGSPPGNRMRHTLRSNSRSSQDGKHNSLHMPSFSWSSKGQSMKPSRRSSRFGDSSDEDEVMTSGFRSRFEDSSDEEDDRPSSSRQTGSLARGTLRASATAPAGLRKTTPVPEEEESPELPDSDDDEDQMPSPLQSPRSQTAAIAAARANLERRNSSTIGTSALTRTRSGRGTIASSVSTPAISTNDRRNSFIGILRRNKKADQAGKIQRSEYVESAARRDTKLERNTGQLKNIRGDHPSNLKLQKKGSLKKADNWPLSESDERPSTAGNLFGQSNRSMSIPRPNFTGRRSVSLGPHPARDNDELDTLTEDDMGGQKKKKKFGVLRRMFRLDD